MIPTDAGIEFTFKKNGIGNSEILPPGVTKTNNPNNMQPGQAYINPKTGEVKYSPKASDRNKTIHFEVQINYPDPKPNNCKMNNSIVKVKGVDIHVVSQASRYNPYYDDTTVKAGEEKNSPNPKDREGNNSHLALSLRQKFIISIKIHQLGQRLITSPLVLSLSTQISGFLLLKLVSLRRDL